MRFDVLTVFPEFFKVFDLSLVGKAKASGVLDVQVHDLRDYTHDVHRTVDDTPFGGGAGMVMKPDVWAEALDDVLGLSYVEPASEPATNAPDSDATGQTGVVESVGIVQSTPNPNPKMVLAIPTPAGRPLMQAECQRLSGAEQIVIACGRYEGIDSRVAEYYAQVPGVEVMEYSLGDYVLNGGEVAAVALVEAVGRLVPGMVGNPESLEEESHGSAGLLEYPIYTRPSEFRGLGIPRVLTSGHHGAVARYRRDRALERTARQRPDMIASLDATTLVKADFAKLAEFGWIAQKGNLRMTDMTVRRATAADIPALVTIARRTFPDACPPDTTVLDIANFIAANLSEKSFEGYISDPDHNLVLIAEGSDAETIGYVLVRLPDGDGVMGAEDGAPADIVLDGVPRVGPLVYLSKMYIDAAWRGTKAFEVLMKATMAEVAKDTADYPEPYIWLGTNPLNKRAIRAYSKAGFVMSGERVFYVGEEINNDVTMARRVNLAE